MRRKTENKPVTERTRVITAKITIIETVKSNDKTTKMTKKEKMQHMSEKLKKALKADDVSVSNVQDFLLEKK